MGRKPMTEEEKAARKVEKERLSAEKVGQDTTVETTETKDDAKDESTTKETVYTEEQVRLMVEQAVAKAVQSTMASQPQVVRVSADTPVVKMVFMDACSPQNYIQFGTNGKFGSITGQYGKINVTKEAFLGEFRDAMVQDLLAKRKLIVLEGLADEERDAYGVKYRENEILPEHMFLNTLDDTDKLLEIYADLCQTYREMVAKRFASAYEAGDQRIMQNRDLIVKLNRMSKKDYEHLPDGDSRKNGAFYHIVLGLNAKDNE